MFEIHQTKGNSEAHPWLSPNDEFANFEPFPSLISLGTPSAIKGGFYRQGLVEGMKLENEVGYNPYKMGVVAGADVPLRLPGQRGVGLARRPRQSGRHAAETPQPGHERDRRDRLRRLQRRHHRRLGRRRTPARVSSNGMKSKETYGTTGTLIRLRFFGGWDYPKNLVEDKNFVEKAYKGGVPMGQDLPTKPDNAKAPTFAVWAMKDPESGNLDRIQIIKGWINPRTGFPAEKIYDVAWSDDRKPDAKTGKLPPVGNTVDIKNGDLHQRHRRYPVECGVDRPGLRSEDEGRLLRARPRDPDAALEDLRLGRNNLPSAHGCAGDHPGACLLVADLVHAGGNEDGEEIEKRHLAPSK